MTVRKNNIGKEGKYRVDLGSDCEEGIPGRKVRYVLAFFGIMTHYLRR